MGIKIRKLQLCLTAPMVLCAFFSLQPAVYADPACTTTLSPGANIANAVNSAAAGSVICLNSGDYGTVDLNGLTKSNYVTVKSATGVGASGYWRIGGSSFIKLDSVTLSNGGVLINSCSQNIIVSNSVAVPNGYNGILISEDACPNTAQNITIDGVVLDRQGPAGFEGRLSIRDGNTVVVKNSQFLGVYATDGGPADGIILVGGIHNITIGPGNLFEGIDQDICNQNGGAHCDAIQTYGGPCQNVAIEGNMFRDDSTLILNESSCSGSVRNNVFQNIVSLQMHEWNPFVFEHNTLYNTTFLLNGTTSYPSGGEIRSNIFHNSSYSTYDYDGSGPGIACDSCPLSYNLFTSGCTGTNCITGNPTYTGGTPPADWSGWQLANGSLGKANAHDGLDRGTTYYGVPVANTPPTPPRGFRTR